MNPKLSLAAVTLLALSVIGCSGSKEDLPAPTTPKEAAKAIDSAFASAAAPDLQQNMHAASQALREGQFDKAVVALEVTRSVTNLTLDQGLAVHNSLVTLEANLINAAANGDANAQRAYDMLKKIKRK